MVVSIEINGAKEFQAALDRMTDDMRKVVGDAVVDTALQLREDVIDSLNEPGTGLLYRKKNPSRVHRASEPGKPPAKDTGRLINSIMFDKLGELTASVGSALAYAVHLEYGTSRMAARPYFRPAAKRIEPIYKENLEKALAEAMR